MPVCGVVLSLALMQPLKKEEEGAHLRPPFYRPKDGFGLVGEEE